MKKKLAIISSYNESCGNASYTEVLRRGFEKYYDVDVLRLQLDILQRNEKNVIKKADKHIDELCNKLKEYDFVNIQFEAGLYGSTRNLIFKRVKKLIWSSKNVIVTMHRIDLSQSFFDNTFLKMLISKHLVKAIKQFRRDNYFATLYKKVAHEVYKKNKHTNGLANIIVHTKRDTKNIREIFDIPCAYDFPLTFLNSEQRVHIKSDEEILSFKERYGLQSSDKSIGIFGFVSKYKGHLTAIKALKFLPNNYKVLIFGSQHPSSIRSYCDIDNYLNELVSTIEKDHDANNTYNLASRVLFLGNLNDDDFINALYCCDYVVLPYQEVNQSGSGIASLALETKSNAIFSNNKAFAELEKYYPNCFEKFDIGNYIQLADSILNYKNIYSDNLDKALSHYNLENNISFYRKVFEGSNSK